MCISALVGLTYLAVALSLIHGRAPGAYIMLSIHLWMDEYVVGLLLSSLLSELAILFTLLEIYRSSREGSI